MSRLVHYLIRGAICVLLFLIYLYGVRPARSAITQQLVYPSLAEHLNNNEQPSYTLRKDGVALWVTFNWSNDDDRKTIQYRPQFGFFFLISLMTLVIVSLRPTWYIVLFALHGAATLSTAGLMLISKTGWIPGFILVDLIGTYLAPVVTLAIAAWAVAEERGLVTDEE